MTPNNDQLALNLLPAFPAKKPLSAYRFSEYNTIVKNILETIVGRNGIKINKPGRDGLGWFITLDYSEGLPWADSIAKAWDIAYTESGGTHTATTSGQFYDRGGANIEITPDLTMTMPATIDCWIAVKIHAVTGAATLVNATTAALAAPATLPSITELYYYRLLYRAQRATTEDTWASTFDNRTAWTAPQGG